LCSKQDEASCTSCRTSFGALHREAVFYAPDHPKLDIGSDIGLAFGWISIGGGVPMKRLILNKVMFRRNFGWVENTIAMAWFVP
jgi:hypothetical protein